jgi:large repetitive protein
MLRTSLVRGLAWASFVCAAIAAQAATHRFDVLLDTDNNASVGCAVTTGASSASGIDRIARITVNTTTTAATVSTIERLDCAAGGVFSAPTAIAGAPYGLNLAAAGAGLTAIEVALPLSSFPNNSTPTQPMLIRLGATSLAAVGATDTLLPMTAFQLRAISPNENGATAIPVPISTISKLAAFALFIWALGAIVIRKNTNGWLQRGATAFITVCVSGALMVGTGAWVYAIVLDGNIGDWSGNTAMPSSRLSKSRLAMRHRW